MVIYQYTLKKPKVKPNVLVEFIYKIMIQCMYHDLNVVLLGDLMLIWSNLMFFLNVWIYMGYVILLRTSHVIKGPVCDLIMTNKPKRFDSTCSTVVVDTGLSDFHSLVFTATNQHVPKLQYNTFESRSYKHLDNKKCFWYDNCLVSHIMFLIM